jgi:hypothetical protein
MRNLFYIIAISIVAYTSCKKKDICLQYSNYTANARFATYTDSNKLKDTFLPKPLIIYGTFGNIYNNANRASMYLNGATLYTQVLLYPDSAVTNVVDTVTFFYKPSLHFVSKECGYNYYYTIDSIKHKGNAIKKINVLTKAVTEKQNTTHFEVIY